MAERERAPGPLLDEYLVALSQAGSAEALDGLARRWTPRLLRYAARMLGGSSGSAEAARDVVQDTWVGVIRGLRTLRDPEQFRAWIYGIATRKCVDYIRVQMRRRRFDVRAADEGTPVVTVTSEEQIDLATAVRALPPIHRAAVHLFYGEDLSVDEIAVILKIPAGTVKSRLHHAREALKTQLAGAPAARRVSETRRREMS